MPVDELGSEAIALVSLANGEARALSTLAGLAVSQLPGCAAAHVTIWRDGEIAALAASHPDAAELAEIELAGVEPAGAGLAGVELAGAELAGTGRATGAGMPAGHGPLAAALRGIVSSGTVSSGTVPSGTVPSGTVPRGATPDGPAVPGGTARDGAGAVVHCADTLTEDRWPAWADAALSRGVRCSLHLASAFPSMTLVLALLAVRPGALGDGSVPSGEMLARIGGTALGNALAYGRAQRTATQLQDSVTARAITDQAVGIMMHALGCDADAALAHLRRESQRRHLKVTEIAARIVAAHSATA